MALKYEDYYKTLGVERTASKDEIQKAYRKLARKYHPDINKEKGAEDKFKLLNEANEVLSDPEKRKRYDALGANYQGGQEFTPPPGWEQMFSGARQGRSGAGGGGAQFSFGGGAGGFSDFFQSFFGGGGASGFGSAGGFAQSQEGQTVETDIGLTVYDIYHGGSKDISLQFTEPDARGQMVQRTKNYRVKIPAGTVEGSVIRLSGQGGAGSNGGEPGDLMLRVKVLSDTNFQVSGHDLITSVPLAPWEAALGASVAVRTPGGEVTLKIPAGSQSGQKLRLRGKGLPISKTERGDLLAELKIKVPTQLTEREKALFQSLAAESAFKPRA